MDETIVELLEKRDNMFEALTQQITALFSEKLNKAVSIMMKEKRDTEWYSIEVLPDNKHVRIHGLVEAKEGDTLNTEEGVSVMTSEQVANNPFFILKIIISIDALENGTAERIYTDIKKVFDAEGEEGESFLGINLDKETIQDLTGFDITDMEKELVCQMLLGELISSGAKN